MQGSPARFVFWWRWLLVVTAGVVLFGALLLGPIRRRSGEAWRMLLVSLLAWFVPDTLYSSWRERETPSTLEAPDAATERVGESNRLGQQLQWVGMVHLSLRGQGRVQAVAQDG